MTVNKGTLVTPLIIFASSAILGAVQYQAPKSASSSAPAFHWPTGRRAAISLSFDDARTSQIDVGIPLLDKHGIKATFYVSPPNVKKRLQGWKKAVATGHEIGNHSSTHPCSGNFAWSRDRALETYTLDRIREELTGANQDVRDMLGVVPRTFAYPCGQKFIGRGRDVKSYVPLVAELFLAGRGFMDEAPNDPIFCDLAQLNGAPCDNHDFREIKPLVDQAMENGGWLVLAGHDIGSAFERQTTRISMLEDLFRYAAEPNRGLWLATVAEVAGYIEKQRPGLQADSTGTVERHASAVE